MATHIRRREFISRWAARRRVAARGARAAAGDAGDRVSPRSRSLTLSTSWPRSARA